MRKRIGRKILSVILVIGVMVSTFIHGSSSFYAAMGPQKVEVLYSGHCQDIGWQGYKSNGNIAGTTGQSRRMEAIKIKLSGVAGGIKYQTHCQNVGWGTWKSNGAIAGTTGQSLRMEAIKICLTGYAANIYDIQYRVHVQDIGWDSWKSNGQVAGTTGQSKRIEAIQIRLKLKTHPIIDKSTLQFSLKSNKPAAYSKLYFMIDETGNKYLVSVAFDNTGKIVSYAPWTMPIDMP